MGKQTAAQRFLSTKQPYTIVSSDNGGQTYVVKGFTWDTPILEDDKPKWAEHDLGSDYSLDAAQEVSQEWKAALVGVYPVDG